MQAEPSLQELVTRARQAGDFQAVVLTSADGLPIATAPPDYDGDLIAAMVALLRRVGHEARSELGMEEMDEVTIYDRDRIRLVCRYLNVDGKWLILAVLVPPNRPYRRVTNRLLRRVRRLVEE
jgi:predicted regulator of Ras-like GTPase activity (Roadblock/LC7/MglB family)